MENENIILEISERVNGISPNALSILTDESVFSKISEIAKSHMIPVNKTVRFENRILLGFLGGLTKKEMVSFLIEEGHLKDDEAETIISEIDEKILSPLREKIEKDKEKAKEVKEPEEPEDQTTVTNDPYLEEIE